MQLSLDWLRLLLTLAAQVSLALSNFTYGGCIPIVLYKFQNFYVVMPACMKIDSSTTLSHDKNIEVTKYNSHRGLYACKL